MGYNEVQNEYKYLKKLNINAFERVGDEERFCLAPKTMAEPRHFMFIFYGRGKVGGGNDRLLRDESFESCLTEQCVLCPV